MNTFEIAFVDELTHLDKEASFTPPHLRHWRKALAAPLMAGSMMAGAGGGAAIADQAAPHLAAPAQAHGQAQSAQGLQLDTQAIAAKDHPYGTNRDFHQQNMSDQIRKAQSLPGFHDVPGQPSTHRGLSYVSNAGDPAKLPAPLGGQYSYNIPTSSPGAGTFGSFDPRQAPQRHQFTGGARASAFGGGRLEHGGFGLGTQAERGLRSAGEAAHGTAQEIPGMLGDAGRSVMDAGRGAFSKLKGAFGK